MITYANNKTICDEYVRKYVTNNRGCKKMQ